MKNELTVLDRTFLIATAIGTAVAYSALYLFHIVLALKIVESITSPVRGAWRETRRILRRDIWFFATFFSWYIASILWASNKIYATQYCIYILLASLTVFYTAQMCYTHNRLKQAVQIILVVVSLEVLISILEGVGIIRLPLSPFSPYASLFGRGVDLSELGTQAYSYVITLPTGFFHNPNNLAAFLALMLPFFALHPRWLVRILGSVAIFYVVYMCGARVALIACGVVIILCALVWGGFSGRVAAIGGTAAAILLGAGIIDTMLGSANLRTVEFGGLGIAINDFWEGLLGYQQYGERGSASARAELIRNGFYALQNSYGIGVGAGGSKTIQEQSAFQPGDLTAMHFFWIELLAEGGALFALIFASWYGGFLWRLLKVARFSPDPQRRYYGKALFTGFIGFILGAIGPSTVIYMLPMWMMVGIGLAVIRVECLDGEPAGTGSQFQWNSGFSRAQAVGQGS